MLDDIEILDTAQNLKNGQQFCPNCGATEIYFDSNVGKLFCPYCDSVFEGKKIEETDVSKIEGTIIGSGAQKINEEFNNIVTIRCNGCGAEVVVDTSETTHARCHWCRGILSINERIPNGTVPDKILPFKVAKEKAKEKIDKFVKARRFYALPNFKKEYKIDNIMGVYFPYMLVDVNATCDFEGIGEKIAVKYQSSKLAAESMEFNNYDINLYKIKRKFNMTIEDLTIETSKDKLDNNNSNKTNNIINSIMPFDTEECIRFESNYLIGFTSEKRDMNIEDLEQKVMDQIKDVARHTLNKELTIYDRGIKWNKEDIEIKGVRITTAYLPVWIYSYYEKKKKNLHYVAVNGRTNELMGSIPINKVRLKLISIFIETLAILLSGFLCAKSGLNMYTLILSSFLCTLGVINYKTIYRKYRNDNARHTYENETVTTLKIVNRLDQFLLHNTASANGKIKGQNNTRIDGAYVQNMNKDSLIEKAVDKLTRNSEEK